ncbi:TetR/AcrR family transcriptional regulator [Streptomyces scabichelini]|uniref:TetR/AcrR family transcriptional regulator n=1 Tax=Streptomyces scabichelini TaxID=2711217 RepID=UPI001F49C1EB|nr:TetR/AcrR family transcriptional regulator [Streptomyces scabichelini]
MPVKGVGEPYVRRSQAERSGATTAQLVDAAEELFGRYGYAGASVDAVAEAAAGVTKGAAPRTTTSPAARRRCSARSSYATRSGWPPP